MDDARPTLEELKTQWKKTLCEAERELATARDEVAKLEEELRVESMPSPDIHYAYQRSLQAQNRALEKYAQVLTVVTDLVLDGVIPEKGS